MEVLRFYVFMFLTKFKVVGKKSKTCLVSLTKKQGEVQPTRVWQPNIFQFLAFLRDFTLLFTVPKIRPKGYDSEACVNLNTLKIICSIFIMSSVMPHHQHHICMNDCDDDNDGWKWLSFGEDVWLWRVVPLLPVIIHRPLIITITTLGVLGGNVTVHIVTHSFIIFCIPLHGCQPQFQRP